MGWSKSALGGDPRDEARLYLSVARSIREERQALGDVRDNGDASCLDRAAELRRAAQVSAR